ncbi:S-layer protein domain-containing protein [Methanosarcina horonobensis]|uniref:S-layer protein domain-containing protein n=1 Tax=Methanosarcina horonobensis TaxID=418008 RepID=UPI000A80B2F8|nr:S-layer protein domain-containing protein [Methanosarcina horonobensis]
MDVWLELTRDGQYIADQIIPVKTNDNNTWNVALDNVQGENDVIVMKVYINNIFVGAEDCIVRIDGIWLIDFINARTLNVEDKLGEFTLKEVINGTDESNLGSLVFENTAEPSAICSVVGTGYECGNWSDEQYPLINLSGENYVPLFSSEDEIWQSHVNKLASLILDSNETHTLKPGETLDLGNGYALEVREIDIDSENVWLEVTKDGQHVSDQNVLVGADGNSTWTVTLDNVQGENDVVVMKVNVKQIFVGTETSVIWVDGIWLIDYASARTLNIGDKIGESTLGQIISGVDASNPGSLVFGNASVTNVTPVANATLVANETSVNDTLAADFSASPSPEKGLAKFTNKSTGLPTSWHWNFWRGFNIKSK